MSFQRTKTHVFLLKLAYLYDRLSVLYIVSLYIKLYFGGFLMTLNKIFQTSQIRQIKLVDFLIKNGPSLQKKVVTELHYSEPTLYRDIYLLNQIIKPAKINTNNKINLTIPSNSNFRHIYSSILSSSTEFKLIEELFFFENHTFSSLADRLFLSSSSIRRVIQRINISLLDYQIQISSYPLKLVGSENNICILLTHIFSEKYSQTHHPFSHKQLIFSDELVTHLSKYTSIQLSKRNLNHLKLLVLIGIIRIKNGNLTKTPSYKVPKIYSTFFDNKKLMEDTFGFQLSDQHTQTLLFLIYSTHLALNTNHLANLIKKNPIIRNRVELFKKLIKKISHHYSIEITSQDEKLLLYRLYNTSTYYLEFPSVLYDKNREFVDAMNLSNAPFISFLTEELAFLNLDNELQDGAIHAIAYTLITHWKNFSSYLKKTSYVAKIGVFFDSDIEHMSFIIDELSYYFHNNLNFTILNFEALKKFEKNPQELDFILTNIPNLLTDSYLFICISMYPSAYDIEEFKKRLSH